MLLHIPPKFDAVDLAHLYHREVYRHHGLPRVLTSDRDVRFTSLFWAALIEAPRCRVLYLDSTLSR
jgi:hypothetical protein